MIQFLIGDRCVGVIVRARALNGNAFWVRPTLLFELVDDRRPIIKGSLGVVPQIENLFTLLAREEVDAPHCLRWVFDHCVN